MLKYSIAFYIIIWIFDIFGSQETIENFELSWANVTYQPICAVVVVAEAPDSIFRYGDDSFPRLSPEQPWAKSPTSFTSCPMVGSNMCEKDYRLYSLQCYAVNY